MRRKVGHAGATGTACAVAIRTSDVTRPVAAAFYFAAKKLVAINVTSHNAARSVAAGFYFASANPNHRAAKPYARRCETCCRYRKAEPFPNNFFGVFVDVTVQTNVF